MTPPRKNWFILAAGINGAGKSTFLQFRETLAGLVGDLGEIELINPDLVTRQLRQDDPNLAPAAANVAAAVECESRIRELLRVADGSVAIETVLSTDKYKPIVDLALAKGYAVLFIYVLLGSVDEAIGRVKRRVAAGGHDVPVEKIRKRWPRSLDNVGWFWNRATRAFIFFNGDRVAEPLLVARRDEADTEFFPESLLVVLPAA